MNNWFINGTWYAILINDVAVCVGYQFWGWLYDRRK